MTIMILMMEGALVLVYLLAAILHLVLTLRSPHRKFFRIQLWLLVALADELLCPLSISWMRLLLLLLHRCVIVMLLCYCCWRAGSCFLLSSRSVSPHELSFFHGMISPLQDLLVSGVKRSLSGSVPAAHVAPLYLCNGSLLQDLLSSGRRRSFSGSVPAGHVLSVWRWCDVDGDNVFLWRTMLVLSAVLFLFPPPRIILLTIFRRRLLPILILRFVRVASLLCIM